MADRPYQSRAIAAVHHQWETHRSVCLVMPTGAGKTYTGARIVGQSRTLWVAHRRELVRQAMGALRRCLGTHSSVGGIAPGVERIREAPVQVGTVQTLLARERDRPAADVIVLDECAHYVSADWRRLVDAYPGARILGLTATPERSDGKPLGDMFSSLVVGAQYSELFDAGHLVPLRVYQPPPGSIGQGELAHDPVAAYQRWTPGERAFVFVGAVKRAHEVRDQFQSAGVAAEVIEAATPPAHRADFLARFERGDIRVLVNVYTLTEGVDVPAASAVILARACEHPGMLLQMGGRVLRPAPGKSQATLVDLSGATLKHDAATNAMAGRGNLGYSLDGDGGIAGEATIALRNCLQCGACYPSAVGECPECGWDPPVRKQPTPRIYSIELREMFAGADTPEPAKRRELERLVSVAREKGFQLFWVLKEYEKLFHEKPCLGDVCSDDEKAREHGKLVAKAKAAGYRPGWVGHRYRAMFGSWPKRRAT